MSSPPGSHDPTQYLHVDVRTIEQHFSGDLQFRLPWFQRAYAWSEEHASRLLRDVIEAANGSRGRYFLGNVMLALAHGERSAALVDGHQRTLTLTILFALLRDRIADTGVSARLDQLVRGGGANPDRASFRVVPQPTSAACFGTYVQEIGATRRDPEDDLHDFLESERKFLINRASMAGILDEHAENEAKCVALAEFLLERCTLVVQTVEDEEEAWEMLSIEESTGLPFHSSERSKVAIISVMDREVQEQAGSTWDVWQARLGADGMARLLGHIRTLKATRMSSRPVEQDLVELYDLENADLGFINNVLVPHAARYLAIQRGDIGSGQARAEIAQSIATLTWLHREYWVPPALNWLQVHGEDHDDTLRLFRKLDRLAWLMRIAGRDPVEQERRFRRISQRIEAGASLDDIDELDIDDKFVVAATENLLSRTFYDKSYARLVLRRLSLISGMDCGHIDGDMATVEHVLPKRPPTGSPWRVAFASKRVIDQHAHRLGNLVILTFWENQDVGARSFAEKKPVLAQTRFVLSQEVARSEDWTPAEIRDRSQRLARRLLADWGIELPPGRGRRS